MALVFELPDVAGPLRQGEILRGVWEHRAVHPPSEVQEDAEVPINSQSHPFVVAMAPDCDLHQDFCARYPDRHNFSDPEEERRFREIPERYTLTHAILCDALEGGELRVNLPPGSDIMRRIRRNQDERYHHLVGPIQNDNQRTLDLFLDFKKVFALPLDVLYTGIIGNHESRVAVVPPFYLHDLIQRFYSFQARVALPD